ncbi:hypothetical protein PIROE2DRAFT_12253 [Piromyces sp. E2]|nr:hypothetical protein PIROE2DRAFT_12253 [Piromyces sp. E2]|eukprot:OUM61662.1 hypothetical protein PIROE2DRAFT_12253 [Piromyces sp. E2]
MYTNNSDNINDNRDIDFISDIQSLNNESFDEDGSLYNKRRCTSSESTHSSSFTQNTGNGSMNDSINKNGSYSSGSMNMSTNVQPNMTQNMSSNMSTNMSQNVQPPHHSYNKNNRMESPRNQSLNNRLSNSNFKNNNNNSPRDIAVPYHHHPPSNSQRTHSLNNPLNNQAQNQSQSQSQNHTHSSIHENTSHSRRSSSLGMMDSSKRNSMSFSNSPVNKYSPGQNNNRNSIISDNTIGNNMGMVNEINRPPRPLSGQNAKKIHRLSRSSNASYLNSPSSLEMNSEVMNQPITESTNQNFLSPNNVIDNSQINGDIERNTPSLSSEPSNMYSSNYSSVPSRSTKNDTLRSNPSVLSSKSDFTLRNIDNDRTFTIRSSNTLPGEEVINRNNTYPLNKYMLEDNQQSMNPTKSYTIPKNHGKNSMYDNNDNNDLDYDSHNKQNSISYLLNPSQGKQQPPQMQEQMMPNDNMDIS